jgi:hypothetical protein
VLRPKRIDSVAVSAMWQWRVSRSSSEAVILASPKTRDHLAKSRVVVITTLVCSYKRLSSQTPEVGVQWVNPHPGICSGGRSAMGLPTAITGAAQVSLLSQRRVQAPARVYANVGTDRNTHTV